MLSTLEIVLFFAATVAAIVLALKEFRRKYLLVGHGKDVNRSDNPGKRFGGMVKRVLMQICVFPNRPIPGFFHAMIFWGFLVFLLVTVNHVFAGLFEGFSLFGHGVIYKAIIFMANVFAGTIMVAVIFFLIRRYVFKPSTLEIPSWESFIILNFIFWLMVSFVFFEAFNMYEHGAEASNFLSVFAFNNLMPAAGSIAAGTIVFWLKALWWVHILIVMAFGVFIPYSKHMHLVAGPLGIFFKNDGVMAEVPMVDLEQQMEAEEPKFGTPNINDFTKKDLLDLFSCAECGRCDDVCPALNSGKDLSPKTLLNTLKKQLLEYDGEIKKENPEIKTLFGEVVSQNEVWDCTTCAGCMAVCPMFNEHIPKIVGMRQTAVMMASEFPEEFNALYRGLENQGNPWGIGADNRTEWAEGLDIPIMADKKETDVLVWIGCEGSYDNHNQKHARMLVEILQKAGVDFAYLGNEEKCCGDPARRSGHEYLYQMLAMENIAALNQYKFNRIVTLCPHGFHVLKHEYSQMDGNYEVVHYTQYLTELLQAGKIKLKTEPNTTFTYHDPCYLGRYNEIYRAPRDILKKVAPGRVKEMKSCKHSSFCCGAGGGGMWKEESKGDRINHVRIKQAGETGADVLVTACPYCSVMFKDGIEETETKNLKTLDLVQVIYDNLEG